MKKFILFPFLALIISTSVLAKDALSNSKWSLLEFQSMDDGIGTIRPDLNSSYMMQLSDHGEMFIQLKCNSILGKWLIKENQDTNSGEFRLSDLQVSKNLCDPSIFDKQMIAQLPYIRSYVLKDGYLYLSLWADGGIYKWSPTAGANDIIVKFVEFPYGEASAIYQDKVKGYQSMDYVFKGEKGQIFNVKLKTQHRSNYFNVLPPHSDEAIFIGSTSGSEWTGVLPVDGEYRIRVYLMRNAARRNESANYILNIAITGFEDAKVEGTPYNAVGMVPCSVGTDPKYSSECSFGVIRTGLGKSQVYLAPVGYDVKFHNNDLRVIKFDGETISTTDN